MSFGEAEQGLVERLNRSFQYFVFLPLIVFVIIIEIVLYFSLSSSIPNFEIDSLKIVALYVIIKLVGLRGT